MARNRTAPALTGEYQSPSKEVGPVTRAVYDGMHDYIKQNGGLALIEMAARGAVAPAFLALLKMTLDAEQFIVAADTPPSSHNRDVVSPIYPRIVRKDEPAGP